MSRPGPPSSGQYSGNVQLQPSSGTTGSQQLSGRGTSSGPVSSGYSGYSTGGQSATGDQSATGTGTTYSQPGYPSSGTVGTQGGPPPHSSFGPSPGQYYAQTPVQQQQQYQQQQQQQYQQQQQPLSGGSTYAPPSSMVGAGGYMSSNSGGGVPGMQPAVYTSSNSAYSGGMHSQQQMQGGMYAPSMLAPDGMTSYPAAMGGYPAMGPVGSTPLPPHGPSMSSMGPVMGPHGMLMSGMDPAAAHDEAQRLAGAAAQDAGSYGDRAHLIHFRPKLGDKLVCSCPMVCLVNNGRGVGPNTVPQAVPLEASMLQYNVHCHISQAFVDLLLVCQFPNTWPDMPCVFFLPKTTDTTITEIVIKNTVRPTIQTTMVVPIEDFRKYGGNSRRSAMGDGPEDPCSKMDPELFMLPITNTAPGDRYEVRVKYFHPMHFDTSTGRYVLDLPTVVPKECLPQGVSVKAVLEATVAIDTALAEDVEFMVNYPLKQHSTAPGSISFEVDNSPDQAWPSNDLLVQYSVWRDSITSVVQIEPPAPESGEALGTFAVSVMPPGPEEVVCFPRDVVFVFDRSGSMTGEPMRYAKAALLTGLLKLDASDRFGLVAFDHDQNWWTDCLVYATPENIRTCMLWVNDDVSARGTTDIKTPLMQALRMLKSTPAQADEIRLPLVFLLTDGCVDNERDICKTANNILTGASDGTVPLITVDANHRIVEDGQLVGAGLQKPPMPPQHSQADSLQQPSSNGSSALQSNGTAVPTSEWHSNGSSIAQPASASSSGRRLEPRIFTFGIGPYCNHYFLKRLAAIGRGMNEVAFRAHAIQASMEQMLHAAALPILSDVQLVVPGVSQLRLCPDPIPDVFVGQPLLVSGKYAGEWPDKVHLIGTMPSGEEYRTEVDRVMPQLSGGQLPLDSIFAKSQLDQLVADAWLQNNPPAMVQQILSLSEKRNIPVSGFTVAVGFETTPQRMDQMQGMSPEQRRKHLVKYAIGGAAGILAVGGVTAALAFGSLALAAGEVPIADLMGGADMADLFSGLGDADCCGGCGDCCGDCGDICGACVQC